MGPSEPLQCLGIAILGDTPILPVLSRILSECGPGRFGGDHQIWSHGFKRCCAVLNVPSRGYIYDSIPKSVRSRAKSDSRISESTVHRDLTAESRLREVPKSRISIH